MWEKVVGRPRHIAVNTLGLLWAVVITPVCVPDRYGGRDVLIETRRQMRFPEVIWADGAYAALDRGALIAWLWCVERVKRRTGCFEILPKRGIIEPAFGGLNRCRKLALSYERAPESDRAFLHVAMIHPMVKRLAGGALRKGAAESGRRNSKVTR